MSTSQPIVANPAYSQAPERAAARPLFGGAAAGFKVRQIRAAGWADAYQTAKRMQKNGAGRWKVIYYKGSHTLYIEVPK